MLDIGCCPVEKTKTIERKLHVAFVVGEALVLQSLGRTFDTDVDRGIFHHLSNEKRSLLAIRLASSSSDFVFPWGGSVPAVG